MARSPRARTPNTGTLAAATVASTPDTPTSIYSASQSLQANAKDPPQAHLASIVANTSLRGSLSPKSPRPVLSPAYSPHALTGAAAMAEARQQREKEAREQARHTSPNPGTQAVQSLLGQAMSNAKDAPAAVANMSEPLAKVARNISLNDQKDGGQTSPISMSSFGSLDTTTAPTATAMEVTAPLANLEGAQAPDAATTPKATPQDAKSGQNNDSGSRAFTFPGPLDQDNRSTPSRGMSLPMPHSHYNSGDQTTPHTRSPSMSQGGSGSSKRHKCPYCSTDFTRHHNLKSHLLTHSQEKPFECPTCQSRFRRLHDLKRHTKLHTGERPHTCPKCGRRFARGDALARHNKGAGGCAGRRSSFGAPGSTGDDGEAMDGLEYSAQQTEEPEHMDEDDLDGPVDRRRSEAVPREVANMGRANATYPPIQGAAVGNNVRGMYPPPPGASGSTATSNSNRTGEGTGSTAASMHFPPNQPAFSQTGMTESPKPLSPGQEHRGSLSRSGGDYQSYARSRTSSHSQGINANAPQLPSLPGLAPAPPAGHPPSMLHQSIPAPGSNPGSHSSHGQSSGGSLREVLAGGAASGPDVWNVVRDLEARIARMHDEHQSHIRGMHDEILRLRDEVKELQAKR